MDSNVISLQISTAGIMQQIIWIGSSSIRTVRTSVPVYGIPGIHGVRVTVSPPRRRSYLCYLMINTKLCVSLR